MWQSLEDEDLQTDTDMIPGDREKKMLYSNVITKNMLRSFYYSLFIFHYIKSTPKKVISYTMKSVILLFFCIFPFGLFN